MTTTTHPFNHLGPAPYRFVCYWQMPDKALLETNPEAFNRAIRESPRMKEGRGSCAHCGRPIKDVYVIQCGDGSRWGVGCSCIEKVDSSPRLVANVKRVKRQVETERRESRNAAKLTEARSWIDNNEDALKALPHPLDYWANQGQTMFDKVQWFWENAGTSGKLKVYREARAYLA